MIASCSEWGLKRARTCPICALPELEYSTVVAFSLIGAGSSSQNTGAVTCIGSLRVEDMELPPVRFAALSQARLVDSNGLLRPQSSRKHSGSHLYRLRIERKSVAMKTLLKGPLCLVLAVSSLGAQNTKDEKASPGGLPPLIDRELIFGNPEISGEQLSPNGKYLAFPTPSQATTTIYVKGVDQPFSAARLLTTETKRPVPGYFWTRDSKYILYVKDNDGDENFNIYAVDPAAKPAAGTEAPPSRDLTGLKGVRVALYDVPKHKPDVVYIGLNDRDKAWHDLYELKLSTGEKTLLRKNTERISAWTFDLPGNLRLASRSAENGDTEILRVDADKFTKIYFCNVFEQCDILRFAKDGKRAYLVTNKGEDQDLTALELFDQ